MESSLDSPPYTISLISMMLFGLSSMLDSGEHDDISFDEIKHHSHSGDLVPFLTERAGGFFASGFFDTHPKFTAWFTKEISNNCTSMDNRERRKYGIQKRGLCMLISYTAEILQSTDAPLRLVTRQMIGG